VTGRNVTKTDRSDEWFEEQKDQQICHGPMTLMKNIRLGHAQLALSHPEIRERIGHQTVRSISSHYGFQSRNHFARDYQLFFGESPNATLQRSEAPGISAQSVSVAHKPQIAMALR
jgi:AraC family ethanolamine operon transcriptional activator